MSETDQESIDEAFADPDVRRAARSALRHTDDEGRVDLDAVPMERFGRGWGRLVANGDATAVFDEPDGGGLGVSDADRIRALLDDHSPSFDVTDGDRGVVYEWSGKRVGVGSEHPDDVTGPIDAQVVPSASGEDRLFDSFRRRLAGVPEADQTVDASSMELGDPLDHRHTDLTVTLLGTHGGDGRESVAAVVEYGSTVELYAGPETPAETLDEALDETGFGDETFDAGRGASGRAVVEGENAEDRLDEVQSTTDAERQV